MRSWDAKRSEWAGHGAGKRRLRHEAGTRSWETVGHRAGTRWGMRLGYKAGTRWLEHKVGTRWDTRMGFELGHGGPLVPQRWLLAHRVLKGRS